MLSSVTPASLLLHQVNEFLRHLPGLRDGSVTPFHDARVATRRMRELLPFAAVYLTPAELDELDRMLRKVTARLGRVRDTDVTSALLQPLQGLAPSAAGDVARLITELQTERERHLRRAVKSMERLDVEGRLNGLRQALGEKAPRLMAVRRRFSAASPWEGLLDARIRERAGEVASAVGHAGGVMFTNRLHEARIAAKKLRYVMEIASQTGRADLDRELGALRKSQETLGTLHDYDVLAVALLAAPSAAEHLGSYIDHQRRKYH